MKERRVRCKQCGERFTILRFERERTSAYCDICREDRKREQARDRMRAMRARLTKHIHRCRPPEDPAEAARIFYRDEVVGHYRISVLYHVL
jgi:hypothetical protein